MKTRVFAEFFGGMASTSIRLVGGSSLVPAVTMPGAKTGFSEEILNSVGLHTGDGADMLYYCDSDWRRCRLFSALTTPSIAMDIVAILEAMMATGEPPREMFDRLLLASEPTEIPAWAARFLWLSGNSVKGQCTHWEDQSHAGAACKITLKRLIQRTNLYAKQRWPGIIVNCGRAEQIQLSGDLSGWVVLLDPPYEGLTGYGNHSCTTDDLISIARTLDQLGATVIMCEAKPFDKRLGPHWISLNIQNKRIGQFRRWAATTTEFITLNRQPYAIPSPRPDAPLFLR